MRSRVTNCRGVIPRGLLEHAGEMEPAQLCQFSHTKMDMNYLNLRSQRRAPAQFVRGKISAVVRSGAFMETRERLLCQYV